MDYINHFGDHSQNYKLFRPDYPQALYDYIISLVSERDTAWDCGTGNGQAANVLADYFKLVIATDISQSQLDVAINRKNIEYICCPAEQTPIADSSINLLTVAQALHWFDFDNFYEEVHRVMRREGIIAVWSYSLAQITPPIDAVILKLYNEILGPAYWAKARNYIDEAYQTIPFPFPKIKAPEFAIEKTFTLEQMLGYLNTWSAVKEYEKRNDINPLTLIMNELQHVWIEKEYRVKWPIHLLIGKC